MVDLSLKHHIPCATAADSAMVAIAISGCASRACDVCGKERARWYCAADLAYLCQHCDGAVHSANAVAQRHERLRLGPNGSKPAAVMQASACPTEVKQEAAAAHLGEPHPASSHFNPRKRPRSIRRHKPSQFHASTHALSSSAHATNHRNLPSRASECSSYMGSILASTHGVMIHNPRSNPDFIANVSGDESLMKCFAVKTEPCSLVDVGDLVTVPNHVDADDQLLESLFDFRDLQDDQHFIHQVPVYNPLEFSQDVSPPLSPAQEQHYGEKRPSINITIPSMSVSPDSSPSEKTPCHHPFQSGESEDVSHVECIDGDDDGGLPLCDSPSGDGIIELDNSDVRDLDQLDFDCVLEGNDEGGDAISHALSNTDMEMNSHDYLDAYSDEATGVDDRGCTGAIYGASIHHKVDDIETVYGAKHHAGGIARFDFDASGHGSSCNWQCSVKVESPSEVGMDNISQGQFCDEQDDALLKEKLTRKASSVDSSNLNHMLRLELNFEDVRIAWSNRGSCWIDGHAPSHVANCLDFLGGYFVPHMNGACSDESSAQQLLVPTLSLKNNGVDGGAREASVLRYREKRHTRLFSKKIRYEVRKLNAEKRPRMKGRFVKRISSM